MSDDLDLAWEQPNTDEPRDQIADSRYVAGAYYLIGPDGPADDETWSLMLVYRSSDSVIWSNLATEADVKRTANEHDRGYRHQVDTVSE